MALDPDSLERLVPDRVATGEATGQETLELHLARYAFAAEQARPGRILDMACGVGYGTRLLAERAPGARLVLGVDLSADAIAFASQRYGGERIAFTCSDALDFQDQQGFDTVVSLETIEHVADPRALLARLFALLRPSGVLVASVPITPSVDVNPHHRHDFTARSFRTLLGEHDLRERCALLQAQRASPLAVLRRSEARLKEIRPGLLRYYARNPRALARRVGATLRHGFCNKYLTLALEKPVPRATGP
jgi:2-polyprenyl-3-methyl-5-hydroxy-6-metoxy-1,4-benzoquinol methylase